MNQIPTPNNFKDEINKFLDNVKNMERLSQLYGRYQDEKEYEDIKDYQVALPTLPKGWTVTKMSSRPFGFQFTIDLLPNNVYLIYLTSRDAGWKRFK